jgi:hypothetical protein
VIGVRIVGAQAAHAEVECQRRVSAECSQKCKDARSDRYEMHSSRLRFVRLWARLRPAALARRPEILQSSRRGREMTTRTVDPAAGKLTSVGLMLSSMLLLAGLAILSTSSVSAHDADYSPGNLWYNDMYGLQVGPNGTYLRNNSVTYLSVSEVAGHWNAATGFSRIVSGGSPSCGVYDGCVYFDIQATSRDWDANCTVPSVAQGYWAQTYVAAGATYNNSNCNMGSSYHPIWVVPVNTTSVGTGWYNNQHVGRHEVGHALTLDEATHACWTESGYYYPLMNNGPCTGANNVYATSNEVNTVISRNGWY